MPTRPPHGPHLPSDPVVRRLAALSRNSPARRAADAAYRNGLSRRGFLGAAGAAGAGLALSACAPPEPPAGAGPGQGASTAQLPQDVSASEKVVNFANWTAYVDEDDDGNYPTLQAFTKETGIRVNYSVDIDDNSSYFNKIAPQLRAGQDINRDIFVFTDWMANRVIRDQLCQPLELIEMPNAPNLLDKLKNVSFDPGRNYSLTWQSGFGGIGYDKSKVPGGKLETLADLWDPELKGRVVALSEFRDTVGLAMLAQGVDIAEDFTLEQFQAGIDEIDKQITDGQIRRIRGNSYLEDLKSGNAVAGIVWSGDIFVLRAETENEDWEFVIPQSGGTLWSDNMMIPITSRHRRNAEAVMNWYYRPEIAAELAAYVNYVCPVEGAQEEMEKIDPDLAKSEFIFPTDDFLAERARVFRALPPDQEAEFSAIWERVIGN